MELVSLYLFTLLGGMAAGAYVFETCLRRQRTGARPWFIPLVVVILFAVGVIAAATHVHSIPRAIQSLFGGTVNFGAGMTQEVVVAALFLILALVDMVVTFAKKESPFALRVVGAAVAVVCMVMMGLAYTDVYGVTVWCNAPATVLAFLAGDLAMGLALYAVLDEKTYAEKTLRYASIAVNAVLAVALGLEVAAFVAAGADPILQVVGLVVAPVASIVLAVLSAKGANGKAFAVGVCVASIVGVALARYAFYAACMVL